MHEVALANSEYVPGLKFEHLPVPVQSLYVPTLQSMQEVAAVMTEYLPTGQTVHFGNPDVLAYVPTAHSTKSKMDDAPAIDPEKPGLYGMKSVTVSFPTVGRYVPSGQLVQAEPV